MEKKSILVESLFAFLELLTFIVIAAILGVVIFLLGDFFLAPFVTSNNLELDPYSMLVNEYLPATFVLLTATYIVKVLIFKIPEVALGFTNRRVIKDSSIGWGLGFVLVGVGFVLLYIFDQIEIEGVDFIPFYFFGFILLFIIQSFAEEIIFRGFLIPMLQYRIGTMAALIISSLLFFVVHLSNPNASPLGMINLICGGFLMGLLFLKYKNIWAPTGFHASWNFVQSAFLGFPVSGIEIHSLVDLKETGNDYITGGAFGYEGSLISIVILILCIVYLLKTDLRLYQCLFEPVHPSSKYSFKHDA